MNVEEEEDDLRKINIPKTEGQHEVEGPQTENSDVTKPLKIWQVNIGSNVEPKFMKIRDYWDEDTVDKVTELLCEY